MRPLTRPPPAVFPARADRCHACKGCCSHPSLAPAEGPVTPRHVALAAGRPACPPRPSAAIHEALYSNRTLLRKLRASPSLQKVFAVWTRAIKQSLHAQLGLAASSMPAVSLVATLGSEILFDVHGGVRDPAKHAGCGEYDCDYGPNLDTAYQARERAHAQAPVTAAAVRLAAGSHQSRAAGRWAP